MELNKFIDFDAIFKHLFIEDEEMMQKNKYEAQHYMDILNFVYYQKERFSIFTEECSFDDSEIWFVYEYDANNANESNNQSDTEAFTIKFNRIIEEFTHCEYDH